MNALTEIQRKREHDEAMVGLAEARRKLKEQQERYDRDIAMVVLGMCLTGERKTVLGKLADGVGNMEVDLVLEDIRENRRQGAVEFFARRGVKIAEQGSVFFSLLDSLSERLSDRKVSNAIRELNLTPRGDVEGLLEAVEGVRKSLERE